MLVKRGRNEKINETVKAGRIQIKDKYKYLEIIKSIEAHLRKHIKELNTGCDIINRQII